MMGIEKFIDRLGKPKGSVTELVVSEDKLPQVMDKETINEPNSAPAPSDIDENVAE